MQLRDDKIQDVRACMRCFLCVCERHLLKSLFLFLTAGGGAMQSIQEPPPALAADASLSALQAQMAVENLAVASSNLLDLIRTLRLSILLMDEDTIAAEEEWQVNESKEKTKQAMLEAAELEAELLKRKNQLE